MRNIKEIIVHCSATPKGRDVTVEEIDRWHKQNGWKGIGYHYVIYADGTIHKGRDIEVIGAHCTGHNKNSIGVCYIGGCDRNMKAMDTRTDEQKQSLVELLTRLKKRYPEAKIYGHRDFARKECPSFDATEEYKDI